MPSFEARRAWRKKAVRAVTLPLQLLVPLGKQVLLRMSRGGGRQAARYWSNMGWRDLDRRSYAFARFMAELSIAADPTWPEGYRLLGAAYHRAGEHQQARAAFERGLAQNPDDVPLLGALGDALRALDQPAEAEAAYRRALAADMEPAKRPTYLHCLSVAVEVQGGRDDEATALLEEAHAQSPDDLDVASGLGECYARRGRTAEAERLYRGVLAKQPDNARVRYALASALTYLQRYDEAAAEARRAVELDPDAKHARTLLSALDWSYRDPNVPGADARPATKPLPGDPLGEITLEIHPHAAPTSEQYTALTAAVTDWFAEGAAGRFGGAFRSLAGPEDNGPILRWRLDLGDATPGTLQTLATRLSGLTGAPVARMLTKRPEQWAFWQP